MVNNVYTSSLLLLTKNFVNDLITVDEFKAALSELCTQYRKDKGIKYVKP